MIDVVIPALNEEKTIGHIVRGFRHHYYVRNIVVMIDDRTSDDTQRIAESAGAHCNRFIGVTGKGQLMNWGLPFVDTQRVIFSDGDYTCPPSMATIEGLTGRIQQANTMVIAVPKPPTQNEWEMSKFPIPFDLDAWVCNSGLRSLPVSMLEGLDLHGYLAETQINKRMREAGTRFVYISANEVRAPLRFTPARLEAMEADRVWGHTHGVFGA